MTDASLYETLGILETASDEEIRQAYRRKMRFVHPDRGGSDEAAKQINVAYETLSDPQQRAQYDSARRKEEGTCPLCGDWVRSRADLTDHLVRHRTEVEAARRAERRAEQGTQREPPGTQEASAPAQASNDASAGSPPGRSKWVVALVAVAAVGMVSAIALGVSLVGRSTGTAALTSQARATTSTSTTSTDATTTSDFIPTTQPPAAADGTWALREYDGSVLRTGSVRSSLDAVRVEFVDYSQPDDFEQDLRLVIDGAREFSVVDGVCLASGCASSLKFLADGAEFMWVIDGSPGDAVPALSDSLHMALGPDDGYVSTCWHEGLSGPLVAITGPDTVTPVQARDLIMAWVFIGSAREGTWRGLDPDLIDPSSVLMPPFSGWDYPTCELLEDPASIGKVASTYLFGRSPTWSAPNGMVSNALVGRSVGWEDLSIVVDGTRIGLDVVGSGGCTTAACETNMTLAVPDGDWGRQVWWAFQSGDPGLVLGFELTPTEDASRACWSMLYGGPAVYTHTGQYDLVPIRAWLLEDGEWFVLRRGDLDPTEGRHGDGQLYEC